MKTQNWMKVLTICCGVLLAGGMSRADDAGITIQTFEYPGQITFNAQSSATNYQVQWAPSPDGPWTNTWSSLVNIPGSSFGVVTCAVPMCYRVKASFAPYLVVDVSGGPSATNYPVSYLADVPTGGWTDEYKTTKIVVRRIPAGTFMMGSPANELGYVSDETQHQVTLSQDFYIGVFQVTQKQWERVMGTWPSYFNNPDYRDARPVERVTYNDIRGASAGDNWPAANTVDAASFMGVLRTKTGKAFDLPTEAQWEYACRAGTTTALNNGSNLTNPYGDDPGMDQVGRHWYNGGSGYTQNGDTTVGTAKVGSYLANVWGLYDMHGNVWEWCLDWYGTYPGAVIDPRGASSGSIRVMRGGDWDAYPDGCQSAFRTQYFDPDPRNYNNGFRVALPQ